MPILSHPLAGQDYVTLSTTALAVMLNDRERAGFAEAMRQSGPDLSNLDPETRAACLTRYAIRAAEVYPANQLDR